MSRQLKIILLVNIVIAILFCYFNYGNWTLLNDERGELPISSEWGSIWIHVQAKPTGASTGFTSVLFPNYPFMLFLLSTIVNLYFIIKLQKSKETAASTP
jgi:hypothetical protein